MTDTETDALEARDHERQKLVGLQLQETAHEEELHALEAEERNWARGEAAEKLIETGELTDQDLSGFAQRRANIHRRRSVIREAITIQRRKVQDAETAAAREASKAAAGEHRDHCRKVVLGILSTLAAVEAARAVEDRLEADGLWDKVACPPAAFPGLGRADDSSARWVWYLGEILPHADLPQKALRDAAGEAWPDVTKALGIEDRSPLAVAKRQLAAATA